MKPAGKPVFRPVRRAGRGPRAEPGRPVIALEHPFPEPEPVLVVTFPIELVAGADGRVTWSPSRLKVLELILRGEFRAVRKNG